MSNIVATKDLTKKYHSVAVVSSVDMTIGQGDVYALIGENGAGKSTLMKMISGLTKPSGGEIVLFDNQNERINHYRMGCLIDSPALDTGLSVIHNLNMFALAYGCYDRNHVQEILKTIGLESHARKPATKLSLGMKQRLAIGIALLGSPDFLILDEPINGLDPIGIQEIRQLLLRLNKQEKTTILISSHLLDEVSKIASKYGFMKNGKLICEMSAQELAEKSRACLKLTVSDVPKAAMVCEKDLHTTNYEVLDASTIRLFDHTDNPAMVNAAMFEGGVAVAESIRLGESLEDFFNKLMLGGNI